MTSRATRRRALAFPGALVISIALASQALGATWPSPVVLGANGSILGGSPVFAPTGPGAGVVAYVEHDPDAGFSRVFVRRTLDGGASWTGAQRISGQYGEAGYPDVVAVGQRVYVVWLEDGIRFRRSADGGASWKATRRISGWHSMIWPSIAAAPGGKVAVSWAEWDTDRIRIRVSKDGGRIFSPADTIGTSTAESRAAAAYGDGILYVAYWSSPYRLKLRRTTNDARSWKPILRLAADGNHTQQVSIAANGASAVIAFGGYGVRSRATADQGKTWTAILTVGTNGANGGIETAFAGDRFHVAYATGRVGSQTAFYRSTTDGNSWSAAATVVSAERASATGVGYLSGHPLVFYEGTSWRAEVRRGP